MAGLGRRLFEIIVLGICLAIYQAAFSSMWLGLWPNAGLFESATGFVVVGFIAIFIAHTIIWSVKKDERKEEA